jgi:hypothetical protein
MLFVIIIPDRRLVVPAAGRRSGSFGLGCRLLAGGGLHPCLLLLLD